MNPTKENALREQGAGKSNNSNANCTPLESNADRKPLDRGSLPTPEQYLIEHRLLKHHQQSGWVKVTCPVHKGGLESSPSLSINITDGHFRCHSCGAKGGDLVALHRLRTGCGFLDVDADRKLTRLEG